jgi:hypothetical protein
MSTSRWILSLGLVGLVACTTEIPADTYGDPSSREIPPSGVIRGSVLYTGPHPCSQNGHIVGAALVLVFDRRNPPPPSGLATTAVNFVAVTGDLLFPNEPRWPGSNLYCPLEHGITDDVTVTGPFAISPLAAGSYMVESFYDYTGNFLPTFKFRNLPEMGDVGGGVVDTANALLAINQTPNYQPHFLPVDIGTPQPLPSGSPPGLIPLYSMPSTGYVADNVNVTIGKVFTNTRPYFYAQGVDVTFTPPGTMTQTVSESSDYALQTGTCMGSINCASGIPNSAEAADKQNYPDYAPILTVPQDIKVFAPPNNPLSFATHYESALPKIRLMWGVNPNELNNAKASPFNMQIAPFTSSTDPAGGGFLVWQNQYFNPTSQTWAAQTIPENTLIPELWPLVVLAKLQDDPTNDPTHQNDPASLLAQGDATHPVVIMQGITLLGGLQAMPTGWPCFNNQGVLGGPCANVTDTFTGTSLGTYFDKSGQPIQYKQDHLTVALRPNVICFNSLFDANNSDKRGIIVTPYLYGSTADIPAPLMPAPIVPVDLLTAPPPRASVANLVKAPPGYVTGQPPAEQGCLPTGRYAINVVYPNGQAWTVPNEAGACTGPSTGEGDTDWAGLTCTMQPRNVVRSQGPRAVVEITKSTSGACQGSPSMTNPGPVPQICMPTQ